MSFCIWLLLLQFIWPCLHAPPLPLPTNQIYTLALEDYFSQLTWSPPQNPLVICQCCHCSLFHSGSFLTPTYLSLYSPSFKRRLQNFNLGTFKDGTPKGGCTGTLSYSCIFIANTHCYFDYKVHLVWFRELK